MEPAAATVMRHRLSAAPAVEGVGALHGRGPVRPRAQAGPLPARQFLDVDPQDPQASFELFASPLARPQVCDVARVDPDTGTWEFFPRPGGGYRPGDLPPDYEPPDQFTFPISPSGGSVGGATVPITTDGP